MLFLAVRTRKYGRLKKWYYGPRADRLQSEDDLAQLLFNFAETLDLKPINPAELPSTWKTEEELRRVKRRKGRRRIADLENLPVTKHVHEPSAEERACPCCGIEGEKIGQQELASNYQLLYASISVTSKSR